MLILPSMNDKINSISFHKSQKPERFINLAKLMNADQHTML